MSLLNLSFPEVFAIFSTVSAVLVTLYLLDRSRRRQVVATLRFWKPAENATSMRQKRRIQQPWSLLLQMISIAMLLFAIAQLQWGDRDKDVRDHVIVLDTSAWMGARTPRGTLMDEARTAAVAYLRRLPATDRVMVIRADGMATPATAMDTNRAAIEKAIRDSKPSASALNLDQAFEFAARVQKLQTQKPGEITYIGAGRVPVSEGTAGYPANLRVVPIAAPVENAGIRNVGLRRSDADTWQILVSVRNYGKDARTEQVAVRFAGAPLGNRTLTLQPNSEMQATFALRTRAAGWLEARLMTPDSFVEDDRAMLEIPAQRALNLLVYTDAPDLLRPVVAASANVVPTFRSPASYDARAKADVVVLDRFAPPAPPAAPSIWIDPPQQRCPVRIKSVAEAAKLVSWNSKHDLGTGLRTRDVELERTSVFSPAPDDIAVASVGAGPVILARPQTNASQKLVVLGFHPGLSAMRYELATPLLFANVLRWVDSGVFQQWELNAGTVGTVEAHVENDVAPDTVHVASDAAESVPYTIHNGHLRFFAGAPGNYRVQTGDRELVYSLTLPEVGETAWEIPSKVPRGLPRNMAGGVAVRDLWPWLALAGSVGLFIEWMLYGRGRREAWLHRRTTPVRPKVLQKKAS